MTVSLTKSNKINGQVFGQDDIATYNNNFQIIQDAINNSTSNITPEDRTNLNNFGDTTTLSETVVASIKDNSNKIGDLSGAGLTETDLATAIKNDRTQLSEKANDTDSSRTTTNKTVTGAINELNTNKAPITNPTFSGVVKTAKTTLDDGNGGALFGGLAISSSSDAISSIESTASSTTSFRKKSIYSTKNDGVNGNAIVFRQSRPSDGGYFDYRLGTGTETAGQTTQQICTTFNEPSSLVSNGYKKFADGLIIQWGSISASTSATTVTFPIAFPTGCFSVTVTPNNTSNSITGSASNLGKTSFQIVSNQSTAIMWFAIGY